MTEFDKTFETSSFWQKNHCLLLMFYEHKADEPHKENFAISDVALFKYPENDLEIIKGDCEKIIGKIRAGKAHELSESDTLYLGACTKGADKNSLRQQPRSDIHAMQRAYCLKQGYMTQVLREYILKETTNERIIKNVKDIEHASFEDYLEKRLEPYFGKSQEALMKELKIGKVSKGVNEMIISRILGVSGGISQTDEFKKADILVKTIRLNANGKSIKESMSFPTFRFKELVNQTWESSELRQLFEQTKFLFIIFQFDENENLVFKGIRFWNMPPSDLEEARKGWELTVKRIKEGVKIEKKGKVTTNNLPKMDENPVIHVRPHAKDSKDTDTLPDGRKMTKQCFWLNSNYVLKQILKQN
jgi:DNA mismatch repair protein MutH